MTSVTVFMVLNHTPAKYLRQSMESILCQTVKDFEFLIVLDGLNLLEDRTLIESYRDPRVKVIEVSPRGLTEGLNAGLLRVRTPLIMRQDADDYSTPDRLETLQAGMSDPTIGVLGDNYAVVGESGELIRVNTADPENVPEARFKQWGLAGTIAGAGIMLRTKAVREVGGWKYPVAQDCYMMHALKARGWRVVSLKTTHYHWRQVRTSISHTRQAEQRKAVEGILREFSNSAND